MPAVWDAKPGSSGRYTTQRNNPADGSPEATGKCVKIGLLNNTQDAALEATERQFLKLLDAASDCATVRLSLWTLPEIPRADATRRHVSRFYNDFANLWESKLDGLIVTGREPREASLEDEPYWRSLTKVMEWAEHNTRSTIWSCLAAHAALLHLDRIVRRRSDRKFSGVLQCERSGNHQLLTGLPPILNVPHSRWNGIDESELTASGYHLLTRTRAGGADTFVRSRNSLFVFFQGHPEYETDTLLAEFRRDAARYVRGETGAFPDVPENYFDDETACALNILRDQAIAPGDPQVLTRVNEILARVKIRNSWHSSAIGVYSNWLDIVRAG